jgi:serine 3-dehydrogenase
MTSLKDKIVLITGATSGIGEACARQFAEKGSKLILTGRREERLRKLSSELESSCQISCLSLVFDVRGTTEVEKIFNNLPSEWKDIEILINNAGLARGFNLFHKNELEDMEEMVDTNIKGLIYVSRNIIPGMVERGRGHVVNIGSIAGHEVYPKGNVYCATKYAVDALTKGMRLDLFDTPIRVSTVDPGLVETEFSHVRFHGDMDKASKVYQDMTPLTADDIADIVIFITSRPVHVQIGEVIVFPTDQASATMVHRKTGQS